MSVPAGKRGVTINAPAFSESLSGWSDRRFGQQCRMVLRLRLASAECVGRHRPEQLTLGCDPCEDAKIEYKRNRLRYDRRDIFFVVREGHLQAGCTFFPLVFLPQAPMGVRGAFHRSSFGDISCWE